MSSLLAELKAAGVDCYQEGGQVKLRGRPSALTGDLLARAKRYKAELLTVLSVPPEAVPMVTEPDVLSPREIDAVCKLMHEAGTGGFHWVLGDGGRADMYEQEHPAWSHNECDLTAALDYLLTVHNPRGATRRERIENLLKASREQHTGETHAEENETEDETAHEG